MSERVPAERDRVKAQRRATAPRVTKSRVPQPRVPADRLRSPGQAGTAISSAQLLRLQSTRGNAAVGRRLQRERSVAKNDVAPAARAPLAGRRDSLHAYEFRVGGDLPLALARAAKTLANAGPVSQPQLRRLQRVARTQGRIDDVQRMFLAGLLDADNVRTLSRMRVTSGGRIGFSLASIRMGMPLVKKITRRRTIARTPSVPTRPTPTASRIAAVPASRDNERPHSTVLIQRVPAAAVLARQVDDLRDSRREEAPEETLDAGPPTKAPAAPAPDFDKTKEKVEQMIRAARQAGFRYAADNLEHWYRGSGALAVMPSTAFMREQFVIDHLRNVHGSRFAQGAENRARASGLKPGGTATMTWTDSVRAPGDSELFYALGGFTVASTMEVTASDIPDDPGSLLITVTRWTVKCSDFYNFDPGKTAFIPGFGRIEDAEMDQLVAAGLAKNFPVESVPFEALPLMGGRIEVAVPRPHAPDGGQPAGP